MGALALQIFHPDFFNGCWSLFPDSLDFRAHQIVNIYKDDNAYFVEHEFMKVDRPDTRQVDGNILEMMKDENRYELVCGEKSRSGGQWDGWEAVFSPCGDDGYPKRLWDKQTGKIDHAVAESWKKYDLRAYLRDELEDDRAEPARQDQDLGRRGRHVLPRERSMRVMEKFLERRADPPYEGKGRSTGRTRPQRIRAGTCRHLEGVVGADREPTKDRSDRSRRVEN
jgi:hypothetical protein